MSLRSSSSAPTPEKSPSDPQDLRNQKFLDLNAEVQSHKYDPAPLLKRSAFLRNDAPDVACADAWKAYMLCRQRVRNRVIPTGVDRRLKNRKAWRKATRFVLAERLAKLGEHEIAKVFRDAVLRDPEVSNVMEAIPDSPSSSTFPGLVKSKEEKHEYFWTNKVARNIDSVNQDLENWNLKVQKASFTNDEDVVGVFANQDFFTADELLKADAENTEVTAEFGEAENVSALFHELFGRFLKQQMKSGDKSMDLLDDSNVADLTISYNSTPEDFPFIHNIQKIYNTLAREDFFFDPRFEPWNLFTYFWRLKTNAFTHPPDKRLDTSTTIVGFSPLFSFFNHSCEPNAEWYLQRGKDGKILVRMNASKQIKKGREIFISYLPAKEMKLDVQGRRDVLKDWIGGDCMCEKCKREARDESRQ